MGRPAQIQVGQQASGQEQQTWTVAAPNIRAETVIAPNNSAETAIAPNILAEPFPPKTLAEVPVAP